jgi:hypothetical protein
MKKPLAQSTLEKILIKRLWKKPNPEVFPGSFLHLGSSSSTVVLNLPSPDAPGNIVCDSARWKKRCNVHIVSHWAWPRSIAEWNKTLDDIEAVYTELCGTHFQKFSFEPKLWFEPLWPKSKKTKRRS